MANQGDAHRGGWLNSFAIDSKTRALKFLNKVDSGGDGTCHLTLDRTGRILFAVNFSTGSVVSFAVNRDGSIGERTGFDQHSGSSINIARQQDSHPHEVVLSPDNRFLFVPDLGTDRIYMYDVNATKRSFSPHQPEFITVDAGLGPRHLLFGSGGKFAYLIWREWDRVYFGLLLQCGRRRHEGNPEDLHPPRRFQGGGRIGRNPDRPIRRIYLRFESWRQQHH